MPGFAKIARVCLLFPYGSGPGHLLQEMHLTKGSILIRTIDTKSLISRKSCNPKNLIKQGAPHSETRACMSPSYNARREGPLRCFLRPEGHGISRVPNSRPHHQVGPFLMFVEGSRSALARLSHFRMFVLIRHRKAELNINICIRGSTVKWCSQRNHG